MQTIGLIGGMSWQSTLEYYRGLNAQVQARLGGQHSARIALYSVDFGPLEGYQREGDWSAAAELLADAGRRVELAGADFLLIGANTMHRVADAVSAAVAIPLLHIADATGRALRAARLERVALLGTRFTMEQDFYRAHLTQKYGLRVLVPDADGRQAVHDIIYRELCRGVRSAASRERLAAVVDQLRGEGAEAVILGCTELPLLLRPEDSPLPLFDTLDLHVRAAVERALGVEGGA